MPVPYGQVLNRGVKYIKINRIDSGGLDRSDYLQQLQAVTLTYPDRGPVTYPIVSVQEQGDYYLYGILLSNTNNTSSKGEVLDYSFLVYTSSWDAPLFTDPLTTPSNFILQSGNSLGYFNTSSGVWEMGNTPNKIIKVQVSGNADIFAPTNLLLRVQANNDLLGSTILLIGGAGLGQTFNTIITFSSSFYHPIENDNIYIGLYRQGGGPGTIVINDLYISASLHNATVFNGSSSLTIFSPEFVDFEYNDYNALFGNAETAQFSTHFMDVDYSEGLTTPINFDLIISGTADRAFIQDSNYASTSWSNIRYRGVKNNSFRYT